jgi:hypothetical protein
VAEGFGLEADIIFWSAENVGDRVCGVAEEAVSAWKKFKDIEKSGAN